MFKMNVGRLKLKIILCALERDASIFFSRSVEGLYSHKFVSPLARFYTPTNLSKVCTAIGLSTHSHAITPQPTSERFGQKGNRDYL